MNFQVQEMVSTTENGIELKNYVCLPKNASEDKPLPVILVAPEWWGITNHSRKSAERLAEAGFVAVTMDVYGEGKLTNDASQANEWMSQMLADPAMLLARCELILKDACDLMVVDKEKVGAIGFCFGGKVVLDMARQGFPLKAVATFHGNPTPYQPAQKGNFHAKVLVAHGLEDTMVSVEAVENLKKELHEAGVSYDVDFYKGAKHGFTNVEADRHAEENHVDLGYNAEAAKQSWDKMIGFMQENLV